MKDYDATGDGTTDDSQAIEDAITAASAAGGGVVYFPPGTYIVSKRSGGVWCVEPKTGVDLVGAGANVSIVKMADGQDASVNLLYSTTAGRTSVSRPSDSTATRRARSGARTRGTASSCTSGACHDRPLPHLRLRG